MNRLIVANWKHNPDSLEKALALAAGEAAIAVPEGTDVVVCPPYTYIEPIREKHPGLVLGAQDLSALPNGAYTGEVGAAILKDLGVRYAILGHSERRALGDSDEDVTAKAMAAVAAGIAPIVCVGEPAEINEQGTEAVRAFLQDQLGSIPNAPDLVVAYEPIWAIGTGVADDPARAGETARWVAEYLGYLDIRPRVLYGGSTNPGNAAGFLAQDGIHGLLVGGGSLDASSFAGIINAS